MSNPTASAGQVNLVLLAGQSNMVGQANTTVSPLGADPADVQVMYYYDVTNTSGGFFDSSGSIFGNLTPWRFNASTRRFGPEMSLGRDLHNALTDPVALIKVATGGSDIARWQPGAADYVKFIDAVTDGIDEIRASGDTVNVVGLVWLQGESDVIDTNRADAYADRLHQFLTHARSDLAGRFPTLCFGQLDVVLVEPANWKNGNNPAIATQPNIDKVHGVLADFASADPNAYFIPTNDFTTFEDGLIHFSASDQMVLGSRIADTILTHIVPKPGAGTAFLTLLATLFAKRS